MKTFLVRLSTVLFALISIFYLACNYDYSPKPSAYLRIDLPEPSYRSLNQFSGFEFDISEQMEVQDISDTTQGEWFNLVYPSLNAQIYCSFLPIKPKDFPKAIQESENFVYFHIRKADEIQEQAFENLEQKVYGSVYQLKGEVPSPLQFVLTDSTNSFFRGALYFESTPNLDSIAPVLAYINEDIRVIIESFRWKK